MAVKKIYDIAAVTGSYQQNGENKNRYKTVGAVMQKDDGGKFIVIDRSFNPAGVPFREGSDQILLSMFPPKDANGAAPAQAPRQAPQRPAGGGGGTADEDVPFARFEDHSPF